ALALVPLVMVAMNLVYALSAYPFGRLSDGMSHRTLLIWGLLVLIAADLVLAASTHWVGLLAAMVAATAPADLRGSAFGFFNLVCGLAMLLASLLAGLLWDNLGPAFTFYTGAACCLLTLLILSKYQPPTSSTAP
uniref:MFS transporter n=1 Tax=Aeromonas hydrophila TaxID=644 RepID=UPI001116FA6E